MKSKSVALLLVVCLIATLAACGGSPVTTPATSNAVSSAPSTAPATSTGGSTAAPIELTYATSLYVEAPHQIVHDNLLKAYGAKNSNVKISIYGAEYANFWNNLTTEIISNNEADIIQIVPSKLASYYALRASGAFLDLTPYMKKTGTDYMSLLMGQKECDIDNKTVAISNYAWGTNGVFYRKSICEKYGVDAEAIKTSDDFVAALKATTKDNIVGMGAVVGTHPFVVAEWVGMFARGVTGGMYFKGEVAPFDADHIVVNSPDNVAMAKWWQDLILKNKVLKPGPDKKDSRELFWNGLCAFNLDGPWFIGMTEARDPAILKDTGLIPLPNMIYKGTSYKPTPSYSPYICAISSNCKNPDAAWEFLNWMTSIEAQTIIATCGMTPANKDFSEKDEYKTKYPLSYKFLGFKQNNYGEPMSDPRTPKGSELSNILIEAGQNMFSPKAADPQTELNAAAEKMKAVMNK